MQSSESVRALFGGAMSAFIPRCATDVSELREIPDNQEVFAHSDTDQSLIVELVEYQAQVADPDAASYHFQDLASSNKASEPGSVTINNLVHLTDVSLSQCSSAWMISGAQCVSKFNEEAKNTVTIHLGLFRLPQFSTDVLVSFNDPQTISSESSSAPAAGTHAGAWTLMDFQNLLRSFTLHDPGVFG